MLIAYAYIWPYADVMSKLRSEPSSTSILCTCEHRRLWCVCANIHVELFASWVNFQAFCRLLFFQNQRFYYFRNTITLSNSLDPDRAGRADLDPSCLQKLSADDTRR